MTDSPPKQIKRLKKEIEIAASPAAVWKALTDGEELARWFPLSARVTPDVEGSIVVSRGPDFEGEGRITAWEPQKQLRWIQQAGELAGPEGVTVEFKIEQRGGTTIVRLVQSGFSSGGDWDDEYFASTEYGWGFILLNLRHYLERHAGTPRRVAWPRIKVSMPREEAYRRLAEPGGLFREGAGGLVAGADYMLEAATGENFEGRVELVRPPRGFCIGVRELNDALVSLSIEGTGGEHDVQLWFSTYGVSQTKVEKIETQWTGIIGKILGTDTRS